MIITRLKSLFLNLVRGEVPVDGLVQPSREDRHDQNPPSSSADERDKLVADRAGDYPHAPVRWGNFR